MNLIDGKKIAAELRNELKVELDNKKKRFNKVPGLTVILIGDLAPSQIYVRCFTQTDSWNEWLKVKERLAIGVKEIVEKNKASFAFPSQSIYVEKK